MYQNIMNYYNIPPDKWNYSIVFDDEIQNLSQLYLQTLCKRLLPY